eukprot:6201615-Pleurochrysis_carterae.AAC.4
MQLHLQRVVLALGILEFSAGGKSCRTKQNDAEVAGTGSPTRGGCLLAVRTPSKVVLDAVSGSVLAAALLALPRPTSCVELSVLERQIHLGNFLSASAFAAGEAAGTPRLSAQPCAARAHLQVCSRNS